MANLLTKPLTLGTSTKNPFLKESLLSLERPTSLQANSMLTQPINWTTLKNLCKKGKISVHKEPTNLAANLLTKLHMQGISTRKRYRKENRSSPEIAINHLEILILTPPTGSTTPKRPSRKGKISALNGPISQAEDLLMRLLTQLITTKNPSLKKNPLEKDRSTNHRANS